MGKFLVFTIGKLFSTPRRKAGMLSFFSGTCLDQQTVLWNKSSSEFLWYPARLWAVNAAMTVYINRGSHPKSVLLDVQRGVPKLCSLHVNMSSATGICSASEHPSRAVTGSLARWLGCQVPWSSLAAPGQALAPLNWPPCGWSQSHSSILPVPVLKKAMSFWHVPVTKHVLDMLPNWSVSS